MVASLCFLSLAIAFGWVGLRVTRSPLELEEQFFWGVPLGLALLTLWIFAWAAVVRVHMWAIAGGSITAAIAVIWFLIAPSRRAEIASDWRQLQSRWTRREAIAWAIVLVPWSIYTATVVPRLLFFEDGNLIAGWGNVWADWAVHLRNSTFFSSQTELSLENPLLAGESFRYPYVSSYLSAILQDLGLRVDRSLTWPTILLFGTLPAQLYIFGRRISGSRKVGILFVYLVMFAGGLGALSLIQDLFRGDFFWQANAYSPQLYTDIRNAQNVRANDGIWFINFIISEWFPQRSFLAGFAVALYVLQTFWKSSIALTAGACTIPNRRYTARQILLQSLYVPVENRPNSYTGLTLAIAGTLFGLLPLIHTHSFIALGIITPVASGYWLITSCLNQAHWSWTRPQSWLKISSQSYSLLLNFSMFFLPAVSIGFSIVFLLLLSPDGQGSLISWIPGWVPQSDVPVNLTLFWLRNAGLVPVLGGIAFFSAAKSLRSLLVGAAAIFVVANCISFQPWPWDNLKLLTYWYAIWALAAAIAITRIPKRWWIVQVGAIAIACAAGAADVGSVAVTSRQGLQLLSQTEVSFAQWVRENTSERDLIAIAPDHNHPISVLSGRRLLLGYSGWLWSYGIDDNRRKADVKDIYALNDRGLELLKEYDVGYVALGPRERRQYDIDEQRWHESYSKVFDREGTKLFKIE